MESCYDKGNEEISRVLNTRRARVGQAGGQKKMYFSSKTLDGHTCYNMVSLSDNDTLWCFFSNRLLRSCSNVSKYVNESSLLRKSWGHLFSENTKLVFCSKGSVAQIVCVDSIWYQTHTNHSTYNYLMKFVYFRRYHCTTVCLWFSCYNGMPWKSLKTSRTCTMSLNKLEYTNYLNFSFKRSSYIVIKL